MVRVGTRRARSVADEIGQNHSRAVSSADPSQGGEQTNVPDGVGDLVPPTRLEVGQQS
jgi:hypothetical protein